MSMLGEVLDGKYAVIRLLGEGGMGAVYEAQHQLIGHRVAVKFLHPQYAANPQAVRRFYQEAQIAGSLGHDNICEVMDVGRTRSDMPYMVMPLLDGHTLADETADSAELLPTARVIDIIAQVLNALDRAHRVGIVHRDLKPENIFLTRVGDREDFVKILDFGISKIVSEVSPQKSALTSTGMVVGTPYYMSPEQAQGAKAIDHRTDIYSTGVLLYELLTGQHPYDADSYNELIVKLVTEPFPTPRSVNPKIAPGIERVVLTAMHKSPPQRYQSAREFRAALLEGARNTGMGLPPHLTQAEGSPDASLLATTPQPLADDEQLTLSQERALPGGRRRWVWAVIFGVALVGGAALFLLVHPWSSGPRKRPAVVTSGPTGMPVTPALERPPAAGPGQRERVTLRFEGMPAGGTLELNGRLVRGTVATVPRSSTALRYQARAPGYLPTSAEVTPDRDRTVQLLLRPRGRTKRPGGSAALPRGTKPKPPRRESAARPGAHRPARPRVPPRSTPVIMGRDGTFVDSDYDKH